jgi:hypothetical protein
MRKLKQDGIYTTDEAGLLEEDGLDLPDTIGDDSLGKLDFSDEEEEEY